MEQISYKMSEAVMRSELSPLVLDFSKVPERKEFLILDGQLAKASGVEIIVFSNNVGNRFGLQ